VDAPTLPVAAVRRPQVLEAGLFLLVVALPLAFFPLSRNEFLEVKLLLLAGGTLLVLASGVPADRRLALPASAWAGVLVLAGITGVDRVESLVGTISATGLAMLLCAAALVVVAPNVPTPLWERARGWLVGTGVAVAAVMVIARVSPELLEPLGRHVRFNGSTLGNPVYAVGFLAACIPAALARERGTWRGVLLFAVLGAGFAVAEERSAWLMPVAALAASAWLVRPGGRRFALAACTIGAVVALWIFVPALADRGGPGDRFTAVGQFQTLKGERQRVALYGANLRAVAERPLLGWGPANGWTGFLSSGTPEQIEQAGRYWADAHNLFLELGVTSGLVGLAVFGWLLVRLVPRALRPIPERRWLAAVAATLGVYALVEPLDVMLTPLLLLFAAAATGGREDEATVPARRARGSRVALVAAIGGVTALAGVNLTASALEEWGHTHYEADWALRAAVDLAPWRLTASEALAMSLAVSGRAGDEGAGVEARAVVATVVGRHPRNPGVRLLAADIELLLRNFPGTQDWIREQLEVFPSDTLVVPLVEPGTSLPA